CLGLTACTDTITRDLQPLSVSAKEGTPEYYLGYQYVKKATQQGNAAFAALTYQPGSSVNGSSAAKRLFNVSSGTMSQGIDAHANAAANRTSAVETLTFLAALGAAAAVATNTDFTSQASVDQANLSVEAIGDLADTVTSISQDWRSSRFTQQSRRVDGNTWRAPVFSTDPIALATVRIQTPSGGHCSGVFVRPKVIAFAAHCTGATGNHKVFRMRPDQPGPFMRGVNQTYEVDTRFYNEKFQPCYARNRQNAPACVHLDAAILITKEASPYWVPLASPRSGMRSDLFGLGFSGDLNQGFFMRVDAGCKITAINAKGRVSTNCTSAGGNSGGPLLRRTTKAPYAEVLGVLSTGRSIGGRSAGRDRASTTYVASENVQELISFARSAGYSDI
ncbi:MAG: trypsin-like serine protease, partial [Pseudomonadota bacterium]